MLKQKLLKNRNILDIFIYNIAMKKERPGYEIKILCKELSEDLLENIFLLTGSLGIRINQIKRTVLKRKINTLKTHYGDIRVKVSSLPDGKIIRQKIEADDLIKIQNTTGKSIYEIERELYGFIKSN